MIKWLDLTKSLMHVKQIRNRFDSIAFDWMNHFFVNGETLPQKHGFPLRLVYEDAHRCDGVRCVNEVVVV
jgi:hypothetical protein